MRAGALLDGAPALAATLLALPVAAGLVGVALPAFGWLPAIGAEALSLAPWRALADWPGLARAAALSLGAGLAATALSLGLTLALCAAWHGAPGFALVQRALSPFLAAPHAAAALGLAFLIGPSGWIARALSPWATGWTQPPDLLIVNDPLGLALIAGLVLKETPFLLLMCVAALGQLDAGHAVLAARTMGYGPMAAWVKTVIPQLYPLIRLPVFAVLAFSVSTVDVAVILGPTTPPPLAVQALRWASDPDVAQRLRAAAAALALAGLTLGALGLWRLGERAVGALGRRWLVAGARWRRDGVARAAAAAAAALAAALLGGGLAGLALWSLAGPWRFPDALPAALSLQVWSARAGPLGALAAETALIGAVATALALALVVACLEAGRRRGRAIGPWAQVLIYLPLLVPQASFLLGLQALALSGGLDAGRAAVIAAHLVFVVPYVFLSLSQVWLAWDGRLELAARSLGASPLGVFLRVRAPMLLRPLLVAGAVGFSVSVGQYLPTLLIGGGRIETLTTEAVALAAGGDRRVIGVVAIAQAALPLAAFLLALAIPALVFRRRRGLAA